MSETLLKIQTDLKDNLLKNILPYWINKMADNENRGFYGRIDGHNKLIPEADKGAILNARILWTFSSAYLEFKEPEYLNMAIRANTYILEHFFDSEYGGTYWSLDYKGQPADTKKQIYSIAFFIYALTEYYRATGDEESLKKAIELFFIIERFSYDQKEDGYFEAYSRKWNLLDDLRLSAKDANEKKTMNTHLHILEAYTNLFRVWKDNELKKQLVNLINIFLDKITDADTGHLNLFFDEHWNCKSNTISFGHDIEASWLLYEAAMVSEDPEVIKRTKDVSIKIANASTEGVDKDGSLIYEKNTATGETDTERHWWVQAEAIVGYINAWQLTEEQKFLDLAYACWNFTKENLIDQTHGEWYWSVFADGKPNQYEDKAGFWKCPYHNSRMCLEILKRKK